jgi:hypothetical protein
VVASVTFGYDDAHGGAAATLRARRDWTLGVSGGQKAREMNEAEVMTQRNARAPLRAASELQIPTSWLACLLLLAAGCSAAQEPQRVIPWSNNRPGISGGAGAGNRPAGMSALPPGTGMAGSSPVGAGTGQPIATGGTGTTGVPGTGGTAAVPIAGAAPIAGSGSVGPRPTPDGGVAEFDAGSEPARNRIQPGQICSRVAAVQCAAEAHCCPMPAKALEACKSQLTSTCTSQAFLDDIGKNNVSGFNQAATEAMLNKLEEYAKVCDPQVAIWAGQTEGLRAMFQGTVAPNGQCKPSGLPSPANYAAYLAACAQPKTQGCLFSGDGPNAPPQTATCAPRGAAGATCFLEVNCQDGFYCANPQMKYSTGKCTAQKAVGQQCTADVECMTLTCRSAMCIEPTTTTAYCVST